MEPRLTDTLARLERPPARMLTVAGLGMISAALAGWLGFSLAIGALFAGLIFSRNPRTIWRDRSYQVLYDFLTPLVSLVTCTLIPPILARLLRRHAPQR